MAEHQQQHQQGQLPGQQQQVRGPTSTQILAVVTLLPVGGILLVLAGLTLAATVIGLVVATPVFILFSPVLVPAAITLSLAVGGFLTSGAFGITALSSLSWILNYFRGKKSALPEPMEHMKRRMGEMAGQVGQRAKEAGQGVQSKGHEGART